MTWQEWIRYSDWDFWIPFMIVMALWVPYMGLSVFIWYQGAAKFFGW